jgi:predicted secreted protein
MRSVSDSRVQARLLPMQAPSTGHVYTGDEQRCNGNRATRQSGNKNAGTSENRTRENKGIFHQSKQTFQPKSSSFSTNQNVRGSPTSNWIKFVKLKLDLILYTLDQDHQGLGNIKDFWTT